MQNLLKAVIEPARASDDKYSRGVVGFVTGSVEYPGAAILGVTAAMRTGIGMVRYLGPTDVCNLVIETRPEAVIQPGRAQAWVVGSGISSTDPGEQLPRIEALIKQPGLMVLDAAALDLVDFSLVEAVCVLTPHAGELARLLSRLGHPCERSEIEADPAAFAEIAANLTGQTVLLKGHQSVISNGTDFWSCPPGPAALATAGTGDVLAGILGALLAANFAEIISGELTVIQVAAAAVQVHSRAAEIASTNGPITALDVANSIRLVIGEIYRAD